MYVINTTVTRQHYEKLHELYIDEEIRRTSGKVLLNVPQSNIPFALELSQTLFSFT